MDTPSSTVGPGIGAFLAFFALAVALWLLMRNMNGRMRRMAYREQQRVAALEARDAAAAATGQAPASGQRQARRDAEASPAPSTAPEDPAAPEAAESPKTRETRETRDTRETRETPEGRAQAGRDEPAP